MKTLNYLIGLAGIIALWTTGVQAEDRRIPVDFLNSKEPILKIQTYETPYGNVHRSFIFGYPVRGDVAFVTEQDRNTAKEGYEPRKKNR